MGTNEQKHELHGIYVRAEGHGKYAQILTTAARTTKTRGEAVGQLLQTNPAYAMEGLVPITGLQTGLSHFRCFQPEFPQCKKIRRQFWHFLPLRPFLPSKNL